MTDRDTFAAAALTGLLANPRHDDDNADEICAWSWNWADAMLRQRERTNHDAVPDAKAYADGEPAPKCGGEAGISPRDGTGNTREAVAWAAVYRGQVEFASDDRKHCEEWTSFQHRGPAAFDIVPLYRQPPLTADWQSIREEGMRISREEGYRVLEAEVTALHEEVERLRLTDEEREALKQAIGMVDWQKAYFSRLEKDEPLPSTTLRKLLQRLEGE